MSTFSKFSKYQPGTGDLAARFEQSWPTTTRHLAVLVGSGLVTVRKSGRERLYRLDRDNLVGGLGLWLHKVAIGVIDHRRGGNSGPTA